MKKENTATLEKRRKRYQKQGFLLTKRVTHPKQIKTIHRVLQSCATHIFVNYFRDTTKAPLCNDGTPAFFSKASTDLYFGQNISKENENTMKRKVYGLTSLNGANGLDPQNLRYFPVFDSLVKLMMHANIEVKKDPQWSHAMQGKYFNFCSVKIYHSYMNEKGEKVIKHTNWHADSLYTKNGTPRQENSQEAGTPVAIFSFGDEKNLWFRRHRNQNIYHTNTLVQFKQKSGSMIVLDARDEQPDEKGFKWYHMSNMIDSGSVTFSFMCRVIKTSADINMNDSTLSVKRLAPSFETRLDKGIAKMKTEKYFEGRLDLEKKIMEMFERHKVK
jgi:hypothetical protein